MKRKGGFNMKDFVFFSLSLLIFFFFHFSLQTMAFIMRELRG
jgi:hypothetical protein